MAIKNLEAPEEYWKIAEKAVSCAIFKSSDGRLETPIGLFDEGTVRITFATPIVWLRDASIRSGGNWQTCVHNGGWRFLIVLSGDVIGAVSTWWHSETETITWSMDWGPWSTYLPDALAIAERRRIGTDCTLNPAFLRVRRLNQAALWLGKGENDGVVIPLPNVCSPLQSLTVTTPNDYLKVIRKLLLSVDSHPVS